MKSAPDQDEHPTDDPAESARDRRIRETAASAPRPTPEQAAWLARLLNISRYRQVT